MTDEMPTMEEVEELVRWHEDRARAPYVQMWAADRHRKTARMLSALVRPVTSPEPGAWRTMDSAPTSRAAFLVRAYFSDTHYMTDPWCVFRDGDGSLIRWPHDKPPTMWCAIPGVTFPTPPGVDAPPPEPDPAQRGEGA